MTTTLIIFRSEVGWLVFLALLTYVVFWLLTTWFVFAISSLLLQRDKRSWPTLSFLLLVSILAAAFIWQDFVLNFSQMMALQIIIAALSIWIGFFVSNGKRVISRALLIFSFPLIWFVIQSQWLYLINIDDPLLSSAQIKIGALQKPQ